ncbi:MAG: PTS transporter subunit IIC [Aerococcus sp.]|nr:PTS transporter subunit IIC [Aerococcus sp.]
MIDGFISFANTILKPLIDLGPASVMTVVLTLFAWAFGVKFTKALQGGLKLGIAITGVGAIMGILTNAFSEALQKFVESTGLNLNVTDVGWAPLATITWGSSYTLYFMMILLIVNAIMIFTNKTNTFDVDIFDIWHLSITGLFAMYVGANLIVTTLLVVFIGVLKIINSDLMKPTFNDLLDAPEGNPMTTTHMNYMMNPIVMLLDKIYDKLFFWLDRYDFDSATLNNKIGFWGSKFAIGIYLGLFVGVLARLPFRSMIELGFTAGVSLELFSVIGQWFIESVEPLSQGVTEFATKHFGSDRTFNIGLDWPFIAGRSEMWAAANVLAPIMLLEALVLPKNGLLPLGGIIAMGLTPALLVVTRGKIIRMVIIGAVLLPVFLYSGTLIAPFVTNIAKQVGAFPENLGANALISHSTLEGPIEKFVAYFVGKANGEGGQFILYAVIALAVYLVLFIWYAQQMKKRNAEYATKAGK